LVKRTWEYIDIHRSSVIKTFKKIALDSYNKYEEPKQIFLSEKTGMAMSPVSWSNSVRKAFLTAVEKGDLTEDERVWCHGLRHNFTTVLLRSLDDKGVKRPEAIARQSTRHGSDEAMEPYLNDRFNNDFS
jgi:integrase